MYKYTLFQEQFEYRSVRKLDVRWKGVFTMCKNLILD